MKEYENFINQRFNYETPLKRSITLYDLQALYQHLNKELQFFNDCEEFCISSEVKNVSECQQCQEVLQNLIDILAGAKIQCEYLFSQACNRERIFNYDE